MGKKRKLELVISNEKVRIKAKGISLYEIMQANEALSIFIEAEQEKFNKENADAVAQQYVDELNASLKR